MSNKQQSLVFMVSIIFFMLFVHACVPEEGAVFPFLPATNLIAAGSDAKVGLAWINPDDDRWVGTVIVRNTDNYPAGPSDGVVIYDGQDSGWVDEDNLENGLTYYYRVFSYSAGPDYAKATDDSSAEATPQDVAGADWSDWQNQPDPFADDVIEYVHAIEPGAGEPFGSNEFPEVVLGPPAGSLDVLSFGARRNDDNGTSEPYGGFVILKFTDNIIINSEGPDFTVFENVLSTGSSSRFMEPAKVLVSQDNINWFQFPCDFIPISIKNPDDSELRQHCSNPDNYPKGFAGINPVNSTGLDIDPTDPAVSGGDSFDLDDIQGVSLGWIQYVKIQSVGDNWLTDSDGEMIRHNPEMGACSGAYNSGFDLDAVSAINY